MSVVVLFAIIAVVVVVVVVVVVIVVVSYHMSRYLVIFPSKLLINHISSYLLFPIGQTTRFIISCIAT